MNLRHRWRPGLWLLVGGMAAVGALPATAMQDVPTQALAVEEAVERAIASSAHLEELRALLQASRQAVETARALRRPEVDGSLSYMRTADVPELTLPGTGRTIFPNIPDNYRASLSFGVQLHDWGRTGAGIAAAEAQRAAAAEDIEAGCADLVLETRLAYWGLVVAIETERVLAEALTAFEAHLEDVRNRRRFGLATASEELEVQVELDRAELARQRAANGVAVLQAGLRRLIDLPDGVRVLPTESLDEPPLPFPDVEPLIDEALQQRSDRAALAARLRALEEQVEAARAEGRPLLIAQGTLDYANPNRRIPPPTATFDDFWEVALVLRMNLFDGGRRSAATGETAARAAALRQRLRDLDGRIRLQVRAGWLDLESAVAAVPVAERNVEAAREGVRVAADRVRQGLVPPSGLLDAETTLLRAGLERSEVVAEVRGAAARLQRAIGRGCASPEG